MDASNAKYSNLGAGIKAQPKHHAKGVHLPRAVHDAEQLPEDISHKADALKRQLRGRRVLVLRLLAVPDLPPLALQQRPEPLDQAVQDPGVARAQDEQEGGADARADDVADPLEAVEAVPQRAARGGDDHAGDDDDGGVAEAEPGADADGALAGRDEAAGHEVDRADVVGIEGMAQAEGVGQDGGGYQHRVEVQDDADGHPYDDVDGDEQENLPYHRRREGTEGLRQGQVDVRPGQGEAGHGGPVFADRRPGCFRT